MSLLPYRGSTALAWRARQPARLEGAARNAWRLVSHWVGGRSAALPGTAALRAPLVLGGLWAFLPCGVLYSVLLMAALTNGWFEGAAVMARLALGSSVSLMAGPWLWLCLPRQHSGQWAIRLAGLALLATSAWALWMDLVHNTAP